MFFFYNKYEKFMLFFFSSKDTKRAGTENRYDRFYQERFDSQKGKLKSTLTHTLH